MRRTYWARGIRSIEIVGETGNKAGMVASDVIAQLPGVLDAAL